MTSLRSSLFVESAWNAFGWVLQEQGTVAELLSADHPRRHKYKTLCITAKKAEHKALSTQARLRSVRTECTRLISEH